MTAKEKESKYIFVAKVIANKSNIRMLNFLTTLSIDPAKQWAFDSFINDINGYAPNKANKPDADVYDEMLKELKELELLSYFLELKEERIKYQISKN